jgi:acid phosphatase (class A)
MASQARAPNILFIMADDVGCFNSTTRARRWLIAAIALAAGCATQEKKSDIPPVVPELRPGILAGYLPMGALPDSLALLPPPPAVGSAAFAADEEAYRNTRLLRGSPRYTQATKDAELAFPQATQGFACALDAPISQEATPHLFTLLRRSATDSGLATRAASDKYHRMRPFAFHKDSSCTPQAEGALRQAGSYPSGHASIGWTWALLLAEVAPERSDALLARGLSYGQSRVICGAHWQSDVTQGRVIGAGTLARLHSDPVFRAELEAAKQEVLNARQKAMRPARDCQAEAAALGQR